MPAGAPRAVHVLLDGGRQVEVDHRGEHAHVDAARRNVRCEKHRALSRFEI